MNNEIDNPASHDTTLVFAAAAAAYRINNGYVKITRPPKHQKEQHRVPNINIMRRKIHNVNEILSSDFELGTKVREHFQGLIFELLADNLRKFLKDANSISICEKIAVDNKLSKALSLVASLPYSYMQTLKRQEERNTLKAYCDKSLPYGNVSQQISLVLTVIDCVTKNHGRARIINACDDTGHVFFFHYHIYAGWSQLIIGKKYTVRGAIKAHYNNCTQLTNVIGLAEHTK